MDAVWCCCHPKYSCSHEFLWQRWDLGQIWIGREHCCYEDLVGGSSRDGGARWQKAQDPIRLAQLVWNVGCKNNIFFFFLQKPAAESVIIWQITPLFLPITFSSPTGLPICFTSSWFTCVICMVVTLGKYSKLFYFFSCAGWIHDPYSASSFSPSFRSF